MLRPKVFEFCGGTSLTLFGLDGLVPRCPPEKKNLVFFFGGGVNGGGGRGANGVRSELLPRPNNPNVCLFTQRLSPPPYYKSVSLCCLLFINHHVSIDIYIYLNKG